METENTPQPENAPPTLRNHALRWGLIVGLTSAILSLLLYVVDYSLMADWKVGLSLLAIYIGLTIYAGMGYRKESGPYLSFGKAYQHGFIVFACSGLIATLFNIMLFQVIDTDLGGKVTEVAVENTATMMANFGAPPDKIDEALEDTRERMTNQYTLMGQVKGYAFILIVSAVFALVTGLIVRKPEPVFDK
ncbi:MAG: DUF4199 domain-containing protein [Cyclobacteriaceae bacterium]|nr:DUF4199 domain-containing protein [Cyclobacteriaceae bacterium]MCO5270863.1 DUF4199 domain-containing protein [Cyclobacteriaceae bacterium]